VVSVLEAGVTDVFLALDLTEARAGVEGVVEVAVQYFTDHFARDVHQPAEI